MLPSMVGCAKPRWTHPQGRLAALRPVSPASAGLFFRWCPQEGAVLERGSPGYLRGPMSHQNRHDFRRSEEGVGWHQGRPCTRPPVWPGAWPSLRWSQLQWRAWPSHLDTPDTSDRNDWIHQRSKKSCFSFKTRHASAQRRSRPVHDRRCSGPKKTRRQ